MAVPDHCATTRCIRGCGQLLAFWECADDLLLFVQVEVKLVVALLVSKLRITMDAQRMAHLRTVEDFSDSANVSVVLQCSGPWI